MEKILNEALNLGIFRKIDIYFSQTISIQYSKNPCVMLASACLNNRTELTCLPLKILNNPFRIFDGKHIELAKKAIKKAGNPKTIKHWKKLLLLSSAVSNKNMFNSAPLILDNYYLYFRKIWENEYKILKLIQQKSLITYNLNHDNIKNLVNNYFPNNIYPKENMYYIQKKENKALEIKEEEINWQKIALAGVITTPFSIITGPPGTGKTSLISKIISLFIKLNIKHHNSYFKIITATPTGKSATRLNTAIQKSLQDQYLTNTEKQYIPHNTITLHSLLNISPKYNKSIFSIYNPIFVDLLIIDESSMIDIFMMKNILYSVPKKSQIILIGDQNQLSPIQSSSIFKDLCKLHSLGYTYDHYKKLKYLSNTNFKKKIKINFHNNIFNSISNNIYCLHKNFRFNTNSGIQKLSTAINSGNIYNTLNILHNKKYQDIQYNVLINTRQYIHMLYSYINEYKKYLLYIENNESPYKIIKKFNTFKLLCVLREGPFGVSELNKYIENILKKKKLITKFFYNKYYIGQPIIITQNSKELDIYNGDVGVILNKPKNKLYAHFINTNNTTIYIPIFSLPQHETCFAMTIHKAQGSEFSHAILILPNYITKISTRELLYTAVTRSCSKFTIYSNDNIIKYILQNKNPTNNNRLLKKLYNNQ